MSTRLTGERWLCNVTESFGQTLDWLGFLDAVYPSKASRRREPTRLRPPIKSADAGDLKLGATYRKGTRSTFNVQNSFATES